MRGKKRSPLDTRVLWGLRGLPREFLRDIGRWQLTLVQGGMEELVIEFFDEGSGLLYTGYFETGGQKLMKIQEGT